MVIVEWFGDYESEFCGKCGGELLIYLIMFKFISIWYSIFYNFFC